MADPTYVAAGLATSGTTTTSVTVNKPTGTVSGHLLWAIIVNAGANTAPSTVPSGWTLVDSTTFETNLAWAGVYKLIAGGSEPTTYTWSGGTDSLTGAMIAIADADPTTPIDASNKNTGDSLTPGTSGVTATGANRLIVEMAAVGDNVTYATWIATDPASLTERADQQNSGGDDSSVGIATGVKTTAGATGATQCTLAGSRPWAAWVFALKGAAAGNVATVAVTLPALTSALTGTSKDKSTLVGVLPNLTAALTGSDNKATVAMGLPALTSALSGVSKDKATLAGALPALTATLTGEGRDSATLAGTLPAPTSSITVSSIEGGTFSALLPALTSSLTGAGSDKGTLASVLPSLASALTGTVTITHGVQINASNTGPAAGGYTSLTTDTGDVTISTAITITARHITGNLIMNHPGAAAVGCKIDGGVYTSNGSRGWSLGWCEVGPAIGTGGVADHLGMAVTSDYSLIYRCDIHNGPDLTWISGAAGYEAQMLECYVHASFQPDAVDPHADACQLAGPGANFDTRITRSKLDVSEMYWWSAGIGSDIYQDTGNSAIQSGDNWTDGTLVVEDSYLAGGNYSGQFLDAQAANNNFYEVTGCYFASGHRPHYTGGATTSKAYPTFGPVSTANSDLSRIAWSDNREYDADTSTVGALILLDDTVHGFLAGSLPALESALTGTEGSAVGATLLGTNPFAFADGNAGHVCDLGSAPSVGDMDVLFVNSDTIVFTPAGFTLATSNVNAQGAYSFYRKAVGGESSSVTVTTSGNFNCQVSHSRWSGLDALDLTAKSSIIGSSGASSNPVTTATLAGSGELVLAAAFLHSIGSTANQSAPSWSSGYTVVSGPNPQGTGSNGVNCFVGYKDGAGPTAESPSVSWSGDGAFNRDTQVLVFTLLTGGPQGVAGTSTLVSTVSGSVNQIHSLSGTVTLTSTTAGQVRQIDIVSGVITLASTVAGNVTRVDLTSSASGQVTLSSTSAGQISLVARPNGVVTVISNVSGLVTAQIVVSGTVPIASTTAGDVTVVEDGQASGTVTVVSGVIGTLTRIPAQASTDLIGPLMQVTLDCVSTPLSPPISRAALYPGASVAWDDCCEGQVWVRLISAVPSGNPANAGRSTSPCGVVLWSITLGIGVLRCVSTLDDGGNAPSTNQLIADTVQMTADMSTISTALQCCLAPLLGKMTMLRWEPLGPQGGCAGGEWTISVLVDNCDCP